MLAVAALATWNVTDPSFSNANGAVPQAMPWDTVARRLPI
jgi:hypothetical protein